MPGPVELYDGVTLLASYATIQEAVDAAVDGNAIVVGAGLYDEDVVIDVAITITGAQAGVTGTDGARGAATGTGELTILGKVSITSGGDVTIDGMRFLNDATTTAGGPGNPAVKVAAAGAGGTKTISNSVFWSDVAGGATGVDDRAFSAEVLASTDINFADNLVSGSFTGAFGTASWGRGIWFDGGNDVNLTVSNSTLQYVRTGVNADLTGSATFTASGNTLHTAGSGFSIGVDTDGFAPSGNTFNQVGTEYNLRNIATALNVDLDGDIAAISGTGGNELAVVLGGNGADTMLGSSFADVLDGNNLSAVATDADVLDGKGGNDFLYGKGGDDSLTGGAGSDVLAGGDGVDTAHYVATLTAASFSTVTDADPLTPGSQAGWSVAGDDGDTLTGVERVVDGAGKAFLLVGSGGYTTIEAAVAAAADGDTILVANGTYTLAGQLNITKDISIIGESEAGVVIDAAALPAGSYGVYITADGVSLSNLTVNGPTANTGTSYGIKINPDSGAIDDRISNIALENVTVNGSGRSEIDVNSGDGITLTNVTANGGNTSGVGIALTDTSNVTLTDIATSGNNWGSVALYSANRFYDGATGDITFAGSYTATEAIQIFAQDTSNGVHGDGGNEVGTPPVSHDLGAVTFPFAEVWTVTNPAHRAGGDQFTFYFGTEAEAAAFAIALQGPPSLVNKQSVVEGPDGTLHVYNGMSIQAAIDAADAGDAIHVHPGDYLETANYNPVDNTNSGSNPLGLLVNKSVAIHGVDSAGEIITDVADVVSIVTAAVQSGWGTNFFVTAADVTITGLQFEGVGSAGQPFVNKAFEVVQGGFVLEDSVVTAASGIPIYSAVYINDETVPGDLSGFVSDITSYRLDGNVFHSSVVVTNGAGLGVAGFSGEITNNTFANTAWVDPVNNDDVNWPLLLTGKVDGVAWQNAAVATPTDVSGNIFDLGADAQILLRLRDQNPADMADAGFVADYLANNDVGPSAYALTPAGELRLVQAAPGDAFTFYLVPSVNGVMDLTNAYPYGDAIPLAEAGDTLVVDADGQTQNATITIEDLTILASADSNDLNLTLGTGIVGITLADHGVGAGANVDVTGNGGDNVIAGNSGNNVLDGGTGSDELSGGAGGDTLNGGGGTDFIDGGAGDDTINGGGGRDTVYFSGGTDFANGGSGTDTLVLYGTAGDYTITLLGLNHYQVTRTADGASTEAVSFENITFSAAVPLDAVDDAFTVATGGVRSLLVLGNDAGTGTVIAANLSGPGEGTVTVGAGGGSVQYDLTGDYVSLDAGQTASVTILYLISDGVTSDAASVSVTVQGVADAVGAISDANGVANAVDEGLAPGAVVNITALAVDPDAGASVTYSLSDDDGGNFAIDSSTGVVTTAAVLDREDAGGATRSITVQALSSDGSTSTATFTIAIGDVDDENVGAISDDDPAANSVIENAATGTPVGVVALAVDPDDGAVVTYTLDDDAGGAFQIDPGTGEVTVADGSAINREDGAALTITVLATSNDGSYTTQDFTITVTDDNEFAISATTDNDAADDEVDEGLAAGAVVGITALATDDDATASVSYSLDDDAGGAFAIDSSTGVVTTTRALDREGGDPATLDIVVRSTSTDGSTSTAGFTIAINDVDEAAVSATTDDDAAADAVDEGLGAGAVVGITALATDADATDSVTYTLDDDAGGAFSIDSTTGVVTTTRALDREGGDPASLGITVRSTSTDGSFTTANFAIAINDVDDFDVTAPVDTLGGAGGSVTENAVAGVAVGIVAQASDADATTNTITYSLVDDDGGRFVIGPNTGEVLTGAVPVDREAGATRSITVRATSADGSSQDTVFTIAVGDVDEFDVTTPVDSDAADNTVVTPAVPGAYTGLTVSAGDGDATTNGITYTITVGGGDFAIDPVTGAVTVAGTFNPAGGPTRNITVQASSADGSTALASFAISVGGVFNVIDGTPNKDTLNGTAGRDIINGYASSDVLNGMGADDILNGGDGNDSLNGGAGADEMNGGLGNDTYHVDQAGDQVIEAVGGGTLDTIFSDIAIATLADNVEILRLNGALNLAAGGNSLANRIYGNDGDNTLTGGGGRDNFYGGKGADTIIGGSDVDILSGEDGDDVMTGNGGRDQLYGGLGADDFVFAVIDANYDLVADFSAAQGDRLVFSQAVFTALGASVDVGELVLGTAALDADDYLIYDTATQRLYYDADGNGLGAQVRIADFTGVPSLTAADFEMVA